MRTCICPRRCSVSSQCSLVNRPVRFAGLLFAGMIALCAACTPFVVKVAPLLFIGTCSAYCLFLALFIVGLALAYPGRPVRWWFLSAAVLVLSLGGFWLLIQSNPETILQLIPVALYVLQAVLGIWLAIGLVVAGSGWVRYIRRPV